MQPERSTDAKMKASYHLSLLVAALLLAWGVFYWVRQPQDDVQPGQPGELALAPLPDDLTPPPAPDLNNTRIAPRPAPQPELQPRTQPVDSELQRPAPDQPAPEPTPPTPTPTTPGENQPGGWATVQSGDTLGHISVRVFGSTRHVQAIVDANPGLNPSNLRIGQRIELPLLDAESAPAATPTVRTRVAAGQRTHIVQSGDTLGHISKKYYGTTTRYKDILKANQDQLQGDANRLKIGMTLIIP